MFDFVEIEFYWVWNLIRPVLSPLYIVSLWWDPDGVAQQVAAFIYAVQYDPSILIYTQL